MATHRAGKPLPHPPEHRRSLEEDVRTPGGTSRSEPSAPPKSGARIKAARPDRTGELIRELREVREALAHEHARLAQVLSASRVSTWEWHVQTGQLRCDERWAESLGYDLVDLELKDIDHFRSFLHPEDRREVFEALDRHLSGQDDCFEIDYRLRHRDGHWVWMRAKGQVFSWSHLGRPVVMLGTQTELPSREAAAVDSPRLRDRLTDLPTAGLVNDRLKMAILRCHREQYSAAVFFVDVDGMKRVNDEFGRPTGDRVLAEVADLLRSTVRGVDTVARLTGDQFLLLCENLRSEEDAERIAAKVLRNVRRAFSSSGQGAKITLSVGVAMLPRDGVDPNWLLRASSDAMVRVKLSGKNGFAFYSN